MAGFEVGFPVEVGPAVAPFRDGLDRGRACAHAMQAGSGRVECAGERARTYLHLLGGPGVEVDGLDLADVGAHAAVDARAADAQEYAAVNRAGVQRARGVSVERGGITGSMRPSGDLWGGEE